MKPPGPRLSVVPEPGDEDPELERYLGAARQLAEPDAQSRARVARALNAALPPTAPLPAFGANAASAARAVPAARLYAPWLAAGAIIIGGVGFGLGVAVSRFEPAAAPGAAPSSTERAAPASRPAETVATPPPEARARDAVAVPDAPQAALAAANGTPKKDRGRERAETATRGTARQGARAGLTAPRATMGGATESSSPRALDFRETLVRLQRARQQLERGHPTASLLLLSELDRDAGELLIEERQATRVLALCGAGQPGAARAAAERLAQRNPGSIYLRRLASSCIDESDEEPADVTPPDNAGTAR